MNKLPVINSFKAVDDKLKLVKQLKNITIAYKLSNSGKNPFNKNYESLQINIKCLEPDSDSYKTIKKYANDTFIQAHQAFSFEIEQIFELEKAYENEHFKCYKRFPNRMLLWHGSRVMNFASILKDGLVINARFP